MIPQFILNTSLFNTTGFYGQKLKVKSVIFLKKSIWYRFSKPSLGLSSTYFWHILLHYFYYHYWVVILLGRYWWVLISYKVFYSFATCFPPLPSNQKLVKRFLCALIFLSVNRFYSYSFLKVDRTQLFLRIFFFHSWGLLIERILSRGQRLCWFIRTKERFYIRKEFNSHRVVLVHQHGRRFIVLEHQYGRRDVMWIHSSSF